MPSNWHTLEKRLVQLAVAIIAAAVVLEGQADVLLGVGD
jgi:hypothetical protein